MKLKIFLSLTFMISLPFAQGSVDPDRVVTPPLSIFAEKNFELESGEMLVKVTGWNPNTGMFRNMSGSQVISRELYDKFYTLSGAVYEKTTKNNSLIAEDKNKMGTAFHIGENLVLTNAHVLSSSRRNTSNCMGFELQDNFSSKTIQCYRVHYCSPENDICLIEMKEGRSISLSNGPALKLLNNYQPKNSTWNETVLTSIGNSAGFGIHVAQGRGMGIAMNWITFYAPITGGNSGGPLLTDDGLVVGVIREESLTKIKLSPGDSVFNTATQIRLTIRLIRQALAQDPVTLEKFNRAVVE